MLSTESKENLMTILSRHKGTSLESRALGAYGLSDDSLRSIKDQCATACVRYQLAKRFSAFADSADPFLSIWNECKEAIVTENYKLLSEPNGEGGTKLDEADEDSLEYGLCLDDIEDVESCTSGDPDSFVRELLLDQMGLVLVGRPWPCNMDGLEEAKTFREQMTEALAARGIKRQGQRA